MTIDFDKPVRMRENGAPAIANKLPNGSYTIAWEVRNKHGAYWRSDVFNPATVEQFIENVPPPEEWALISKEHERIFSSKEEADAWIKTNSYCSFVPVRIIR